jgi:hypothetical protein
VDANYATPDGQRIANAYGVKSHPVTLVIAADNTMVTRINGVPDEAALVVVLAALCR